MTSRAIGAAVLAAVLLAAEPAQAQRRELQQLAADLRILQEQTQLLQNAVVTLTEAVRAVNTRIDEQAGGARKGFADAKVQADATGQRSPRGPRTRRRHQRADHVAVAGSRGAPRGDLGDAGDEAPTDPAAAGLAGHAVESGDPAPEPATTARRAPAAPPSSSTPAPAPMAGFAEPSLRHGVGRLHRRQLRSGDRGLHQLRAIVPEERVRRQRAVLHRRELPPARPAGRSGRGVRPGDLHLPGQRRRRPVVLQARLELRAAEPARSRPRSLRLPGQDRADSDAGRLAKQRLDGLNRSRPQ